MVWSLAGPGRCLVLLHRVAMGWCNKKGFGQPGSIHINPLMRRVAVWVARDRSLQRRLANRAGPLFE